MWNYIKGVLRTGEIFRKGYYVFMALFVALLAIISFPFGTILFGPGAIVLIKEVIRMFSEDGVVPYWGTQFGKKTVFKLLAEDKFYPYRDRKGRLSRRVWISKSGRWIRIKGQYYPIALIKRVIFPKNQSKCWMQMIDGTEISLDSDYRRKSIALILKEIFESTTDYSDEVCRNAYYAVKAEGDYASIGEANWEDFRYRWEQKCIEISSENASKNQKEKHLREISDGGYLRRTIYNRSFTEEELDAVTEAFKKGKIKDLREFADFSKYQRDIYVCNLVKVCEKVGYPDNVSMMDFLFECIEDIKKPYCDDAIRALQTFPRQRLISTIETNVLFAYNEGNYVWGAGLIALAKSINYEISLAKESEQQETEQIQIPAH